MTNYWEKKLWKAIDGFAFVGIMMKDSPTKRKKVKRKMFLKLIKRRKW